MTAARKVLGHPALAVAGGTAILFTVARIPTEIFYGRFGIRPEDAGFNSVQVLLQGAATVLALSFAISVAYGIGLPLLNALYYGLLWRSLRKIAPNFPSPQAKKSRLGRLFIRIVMPSSPGFRVAFRRIIRLGPLIVPVLAIAVASLLLVSGAISDSEAIYRGSDPSTDMPWRAHRVQVLWTTPKHIDLPGCRWLFYLGENDSRVILFDSKSDRTYRLANARLDLEFPPACDR